MARVKRNNPAKTRVKKPKRVKVKKDNGKFRSGLEQRLWEGPLKGIPYEEKTFKYTAIEERKYTPDGFISDKVWLEVKGRFRTRAEARKYQHIQKCYPDVYIIFVLAAREVPLPGATIRKKDGKKRTHEEWLTENGFVYCYEDTVDIFLKEQYPDLIREDIIPSIKEVKWRKRKV